MKQFFENMRSKKNAYCKFIQEIVGKRQYALSLYAFDTERLYALKLQFWVPKRKEAPFRKNFFFKHIECNPKDFENILNQFTKLKIRKRNRLKKINRFVKKWELERN